MSYLRVAGKRGTTPPMQNPAPPTIFNQARRKAKWDRVLAGHRNGEAASYLLDDAVDDVIERLKFTRTDCKNALIIGDWIGNLIKYLRGNDVIVDNFGVGELDEEHPFGDDRYDLIVHLLGLGTINDLPGSMLHFRNALTADGMFVAVFPGAGSLPQLRSIMLAADGNMPAARMHPMIDQKIAAALLQRAGFRRQVVDSHTITVRFSALSNLLGDLRDHGLTNAMEDYASPISKKGLHRARKAFQTAAGHRHKLVERFEMVVVTGWK